MFGKQRPVLDRLFKAQYHPLSLYELCGLWTDADEFNNYGSGKDIFLSCFRGEEISERLRFFVEECDHIQGFQFIVDDSGGLSALSADLLESIADEYTNTPALLYSVRGPGSHMNPDSRKGKISRDMHDSISFSRLSSFCKSIVPAGLPFLSRSKASNFLSLEEKPYHCSAIYASAIHAITLPFRMAPPGPTVDSCYASGGMGVYELVQMLTGQDRQNMTNILDVAMLAPPVSEKQVEKSLLGNLYSLTPEIAEVEDFQAVESLTVHGALGLGGRRASVSEVTDTVNVAYKHALMRPKFCHLSVAPSPNTITVSINLRKSDWPAW